MQDTTYKKNRIVFREGDSADCMYYIKWGGVKLYRGYDTRAEEELATLQRGDFFGEMGLIDHAPRTATAVTIGDETILQRVDEAEFGQFLADNPAKVQAIMAGLSQRIRNTTTEYLSLCEAVREAVGVGTLEVDETSDYNFSNVERIKAVHDDLAR